MDRGPRSGQHRPRRKKSDTKDWVGSKDGLEPRCAAYVEDVRRDAGDPELYRRRCRRPGGFGVSSRFCPTHARWLSLMEMRTAIAQSDPKPQPLRCSCYLSRTAGKVVCTPEGDCASLIGLATRMGRAQRTVDEALSSRGKDDPEDPEAHRRGPSGQLPEDRKFGVSVVERARDADVANAARLAHKEAAKAREVVECRMRVIIPSKRHQDHGVAFEVDLQMTREQLDVVQRAHARDELIINWIKGGR